MITLDIYNLVKDFETVRFDPDSKRPNFIGLKDGSSSSAIPGWTIIKLIWQGPVSDGIKDIQKISGIYDKRESLFVSLKKPGRVKS